MTEPGKIGRTTVYRVKISRFDDVDLQDYQLVCDGTASADSVSLPYRLYFLNQPPPRAASWYWVFRDLLETTPHAEPIVAVAGFVLLVQVNESFYAVTGGVGHTHLKQAASLEYRFGIALAQKILSVPEIRGLAQRDTGGIVNSLDRVFRGSYDPAGEVANLKRVLTKVRGKLSKENEHYRVVGGSIDAGDAVTANRSRTFHELMEFLVAVDRVWRSDERGLRIPQLECIEKKRNAPLLDALDAALVERLAQYNPEGDDFFLDSPEVLYLPDRVDSYRLTGPYRGMAEQPTYEACLDQVRQVLSNLDQSDRLAAYRKINIDLTFDDGHHERIALRKYICGDLALNHEVYFINQGLWFKASPDYLDLLERELEEIPFRDPADLGLLEWDTALYNGEDAEAKFNGAHTDHVVLDCRFVTVPGQRGKIELCDLMKDVDGKVMFVHVKHAHGAALRALFAQGLVSAELFALSTTFRDRVCAGQLSEKNGPLSEEDLALLASLRTKPRHEITVVFAIFDEDEGHGADDHARTVATALKGTLTLFAKVDLVGRVSSLRTMGYNIAVTRIRPWPPVRVRGQASRRTVTA